MKGQYEGPMSIEEFRQAFFQDYHILLDSQDETVRIRNATIYINFCDHHGRTVDIHNDKGLPIDSYISGGAYACAADQYDSIALEPATTIKTRPLKIRTAPPKSPPSLPFAPY